jgi:hypothetical protein
VARRYLATKSTNLLHSWTALNLMSVPEWFPEKDSEFETAAAVKSLEIIGKVCVGRSFFSTKGGRIGLGPPHTQPGDKICIFYNGHTPFIIRPRISNSSVNILVGETYVHGIMYGEQLNTKVKKTDQWFTME